MTEASSTISQVAAVLPVICYILFIWWLDRYEREPFKMVALTFLFGASFGILFGALGSALVVKQLGIEDLLVTNALIAPITEEPAKAMVLFFLMGITRHFDNTTDGLVYGAATGLGFAMTENYFYFRALEGTEGFLSVVVLRSMFTALMHSCASATFGACLGYYRYRSRWDEWIKGPVIGLCLAVAIHGIFNGLLTLASRDQEMSYAAAGFGLVPLLGTTLFVVTMVSLIREHRMLRNELEAEAAAGMLPPQHAAIVPFWTRRWRSGWLAPHVDKDRYIRAVTTLAFRRHQLGRRQHSARLRTEIEALRGEIRDMLTPGARLPS